MPPNTTPASLLRTVEQGLQGLLEVLPPGESTVVIPAAWIRQWLAQLETVRVVMDDETAPLPRLGIATALVVAFWSGLALGWALGSYPWGA